MARYLSLGKHAAEIGVGEQTLRRAARRGEVPGAFQIGARWMVNVDAFEAAQLEAARAIALRQVEVEA